MAEAVKDKGPVVAEAHQVDTFRKSESRYLFWSLNDSPSCTQLHWGSWRGFLHVEEHNELVKKRPSSAKTKTTMRFTRKIGTRG